MLCCYCRCIRWLANHLLRHLWQASIASWWRMDKLERVIDHFYSPLHQQTWSWTLNTGDRNVLGTGARFSKDRKTFRARKAMCEIVNHLFWKADLLTCFQGNKKKNNYEVWRIKSSSFLRYKWNCDTRKWPVKFRDFRETAFRTVWGTGTFLIPGEFTSKRKCPFSLS